jgi:quinol monooxygenase YgiN
MIVVVVKYSGKPGAGDTIFQHLQKMASKVKEQESGCFLYQVSRSPEIPDNFLLYEHYLDEAALAAHSGTPYFKEIVIDTIVPLLEKRQRELYSLVLA